MTRRQKIVVGAVLVLLVLLYSGAAATAGGPGGDSASLHPGGIVGWLGGLVGSPPTVARSDESAPCLAGDTLTIKQTCSLAVAKSSTKTRQVKLHVTDALTIDTRSPNSDNTISQDAKAGSDISVTVDDKGTNILFTCADSSNDCVVTLTGGR